MMLTSTAAPNASMTQTNLGPSEAPSRTSSPPEGELPVVVRQAKDKDAKVIADIGWRVFEATFAHTCSADDMNDYLNTNFTPDVISAELRDERKTFSVASIGDQVAAFAALTTGTHEPCLEHIPAPERVELQRVYADINFHGRGVARALLDETLSVARKQGYKYIWLGVWEHNYRARRFYEKIGFKMVGSHDFWLGKDQQTDDIFLLEL
jgi:ribosomal protein S18 acetylase RimI-like enzyme